MKKYIPLLIITSLLLSACSIDWGNKDNLFQKKQECIKLEKEMWEQLNSNERYGNRMESTTLYLSMIFYSPARNSCLYKSEFILGSTYQLEINDFFTKEIIYNRICDGLLIRNGVNDCSQDFDKKLLELKGE